MPNHFEGLEVNVSPAPIVLGSTLDFAMPFHVCHNSGSPHTGLPDVGLTMHASSMAATATAHPWFFVGLFACLLHVTALYCYNTHAPTSRKENAATQPGWVGVLGFDKW